MRKPAQHPHHAGQNHHWKKRIGNRIFYITDELVPGIHELLIIEDPKIICHEICTRVLD